MRRGEYELGAGPLARGAQPGATGYGNQWWTIDGRVTAWGIHGQRIAVGGETVVVVPLVVARGGGARGGAPGARGRGLASVRGGAG